MDIIEINDQLLAALHLQAAASERKRMNYDLRTTAEDGSQRMLNALMPGTVVPVHRHRMSNECVLCLSGKVVEVLYEVVPGKRLMETARYVLDPGKGNHGCVVPAGAWHTVEVLEPSVIFEAKDGKYGEDGSETW